MSQYFSKVFPEPYMRTFSLVDMHFVESLRLTAATCDYLRHNIYLVGIRRESSDLKKYTLFIKYIVIFEHENVLT